MRNGVVTQTGLKIKVKVKVVGTGPHQGKGIETNPLTNPTFYSLRCFADWDGRVSGAAAIAAKYRRVAVPSFRVRAIGLEPLIQQYF
ncbi:hypothetical protein AwEntero_20560 [Enterobacterales bacterium]|nr:hypothetical protein AwEntero_20560 [Enterobacterales bacterium]